MDPTAKEITLTNKDVTPTVMSILWVISEGCADFDRYSDELFVALSDPDVQNNIRNASRYLLIDELILFTEPPVLDMISKYGYQNIIDVNNVFYDHYFEYLHQAIILDYDVYLSYMYSYLPKEGTVDSDNTLFFDAIFADRLNILQLITRERNINPATAKISSDQIRFLDQYYPKLNLSELSRMYSTIAQKSEEPATSESLCYASALGYIDIVQWLLTFPEVNDKQGVALSVSLVRGHLDIAKLLLDHFQYNLDDIDSVSSALQRYYEYYEYYQDNIGRAIKFLQSYPPILSDVLFGLSGAIEYTLPLIPLFDNIDVLRQFLTIISLYMAEYNIRVEDEQPLINAIEKRIAELSQ